MIELTRIAIIDEIRLFREGIKSALAFEKTFQVVADGDDYTKVWGMIKEHHPDVIIMDINTIEPNSSIKTIRDLRNQYQDTQVIILSNMIDEYYVTQFILAGASGYLLKDIDTYELIKSIKIVSGGGSYLHPKITHILINEYRKLALKTVNNKLIARKVVRPYHLLTRREYEVLTMLANGKSNRAIGESLIISDKTVKNHISSILKKMKVNDRTQAVLAAIKNGWVEVPRF